jgi:hypothetical protein
MFYVLLSHDGFAESIKLYENLQDASNAFQKTLLYNFDISPCDIEFTGIMMTKKINNGSGKHLQLGEIDEEKEVYDNRVFCEHCGKQIVTQDNEYLDEDWGVCDSCEGEVCSDCVSKDKCLLCKDVYTIGDDEYDGGNHGKYDD